MAEIIPKELDPTVIPVQEELREVAQQLCIPNTLGQTVTYRVMTSSAEEVRSMFVENGLQDLIELPQTPGFPEPSHLSTVEISGSYRIGNVIVKNQVTGKGKVVLPNSSKLRTSELSILLPGNGSLEDGRVFLHEQKVRLWGVSNSEPPILDCQTEVRYGDTKMQISPTPARSYDPDKALTFLQIFSELASTNT